MLKKIIRQAKACSEWIMRKNCDESNETARGAVADARQGESADLVTNSLVMEAVSGQREKWTRVRHSTLRCSDHAYLWFVPHGRKCDVPHLIVNMVQLTTDAVFTFVRTYGRGTQLMVMKSWHVMKKAELPREVQYGPIYFVQLCENTNSNATTFLPVSPSYPMSPAPSLHGLLPVHP